jgi:hypothetical protein
LIAIRQQHQHLSAAVKGKIAAKLDATTKKVKKILMKKWVIDGEYLGNRWLEFSVQHLALIQ